MTTVMSLLNFVYDEELHERVCTENNYNAIQSHYTSVLDSISQVDK